MIMNIPQSHSTEKTYLNTEQIINECQQKYSFIYQNQKLNYLIRKVPVCQSIIVTGECNKCIGATLFQI